MDVDIVVNRWLIAFGLWANQLRPVDVMAGVLLAGLLLVALLDTLPAGRPIRGGKGVRRV